MPLVVVVSTKPVLVRLVPGIVTYGPPETVDLLTLYVTASAVGLHDNVTWEFPAAALRPAGAAGSAGIGFALTSLEFGPSPAKLAAETT